MADSEESDVSNWREAESRHGTDDEVIGVSTLGRLFEGSTSRNRDRNAQLYKGGVYDRSLVSEGVIDASAAGRYSPLTYNEMQHIVHNLAAGFRDMGIEPGDRVGLFASTRMEWAQVDFALHVAGGVVTTVYTESSPEQVQFLLGDCSASAVVVENQELLERVLAVEDQLDLSLIVVMDEYAGYDDREDILTLGELHRRGEGISWPLQLESWLNERDVDDLASIIYTSGTTGKPKGVRLTHRQLRSNINQTRTRLGPRPDKDPELPVIDKEVTTLAFLPLAHVFERTANHFLMFASGATVAYAESSDTVADDLQTVQPSNIASVPRIYERIYDSMLEEVSGSSLKERIFDWSVGVAREHARSDSHGIIHRLKYALADRLVYSDVKEQLGGNINIFISGGGSLSKDLSELFLGMGVRIVEGYGLTEASPVVSVNPLENVKPGTLGPPLPGVEVGIDQTVLSEEQKQHMSGDVGELLVQGPNVTEGYWENQAATEDAFTNGWLRTGDIVEQTDDGYLIFHDRLKQVLVLSTGKNISPRPIEDEFATSDRIEQIMVIGDNEKFVAALIVPNFETIERWANQRQVNLPDNKAAICQNDLVKRWVLEEVDMVNEQLEYEERIKMFELIPEEWTPDNDLLTPSLKKKRRNILQRYAGQVDRIYADTTRPALPEH
ncbi:AMP-dependent synthetase/ligase [Halocatena salina]|uniref:Long-chain fatty acid--CoA ligase n=1 Tax=Halocatena salina TaxID=2934340 RepID=A0A8U0A2J1_9EURY|nr:long-chain fatty acid--CoA ligase [Halocatena salina]UPM43292.1 long-chain fatty acid--CoA ligase [Halocatena salina]